jgi:hypothetical protein
MLHKQKNLKQNCTLYIVPQIQPWSYQLFVHKGCSFQKHGPKTTSQTTHISNVNYSEHIGDEIWMYASRLAILTIKRKQVSNKPKCLHFECTHFATYDRFH